MRLSTRLEEQWDIVPLWKEPSKSQPQPSLPLDIHESGADACPTREITDVKTASFTWKTFSWKTSTITHADFQ